MRGYGGKRRQARKSTLVIIIDRITLTIPLRGNSINSSSFLISHLGSSLFYSVFVYSLSFSVSLSCSCYWPETLPLHLLPLPCSSLLELRSNTYDVLRVFFSYSDLCRRWICSMKFSSRSIFEIFVRLFAAWKVERAALSLIYCFVSNECFALLPTFRRFYLICVFLLFMVPW